MNMQKPGSIILLENAVELFWWILDFRIFKMSLPKMLFNILHHSTKHVIKFNGKSSLFKLMNNFSVSTYKFM